MPQQAMALERTLHEEGFDYFYQYVPDLKETFPPFWRFLQDLSKFDCSCRSGAGGPPDCKIRECAKSKQVTVCPSCDLYPCKLVEGLAEHYPLLIQDGRRMKKTRFEAWIKEQQERAKRGFSYADIRHPP